MYPTYYKVANEVIPLGNLSAYTGSPYYTSAIASGEALVIYRIGEWTEPPGWLQRSGHGLFAFSDLVSAIYFWENLTNPHGAKIFTCEAEGVTTKMPKYLGLYSLSHGRAVVDTKNFPPNTIMCDRIKLVHWIGQPRTYAREHGIYVA